MKKFYYAAFAWTIIGLAAGLFYRTFAQQIHGYDGATDLSILHTHLFALGTLLTLIALAFDKIFSLSRFKSFGLFFWHYTAGLVLTAGVMLFKGIQQVVNDGNFATGGALAGISGLGHILISVGLLLFFVALGRALKSK